MKKIFKKVIVMVLLFTLVFTFTVKPKKADAVVGELSIAAYLAAGGVSAGTAAALAYAAPVVVALAAGVVMYAAIDGQGGWETMEEYGAQIKKNLIAKGKTIEEFVTQNADGGYSVTATPEFIASASQAIDTMPATIEKDAGSFTEMYSGNTFEFGNMTGFYDLAIPLQGMNGKTITFDSTQLIDNVQFDFEYTGQSGLSSGYEVARYVGLIDGKYRYQATFEGYGAVTLNTITRAFANGSGSAFTGKITYALGDITQGTTINTKDTFGTVAESDYQRQLAANAALAENQVLTIAANQDMTNATLSDISDITASSYDETRTQTGILSNIWSTIKGIPANIAAAGVAASTAINAAASDLWEDAGAIWSGLADTATGIRSDITAKMGALQDSMAGGIDNVRSGINDMIAGLNAGIDTVSNNMAAWGQLTLDGIDAGVGAITTGLTNTWTNITTAVTDGVGALQEDLTSIKTFVADFPTTILRVFVPPNFDFMQPLITATTSTLRLKFGPLETLPDVFRNIFGSGKSIYDIEITVMGNTYKIIPIILKPVIDGARPFLTGAINLMTLTILYRRYKGNLVIPA